MGMHLCRQGLFLVHRWAKWATTMARVTLRRRPTQIRFCTDPTRAESAQRRVSYQLQRQVGRLIVRIFLISVASFAAILVLCAVMATLQQRWVFLWRRASSDGDLWMRESRSRMLALPC